jgi:hypothetical protein
MFKLKVTFPRFPGVESVYTSKIDDFSEVIALNSVSEKWGKPEHWVLHKDEPMAQAYDDADVLEEEMRDTLDGVAQKWVKLKAQYTVEVTDISAQVVQDAINAEALAYLSSTDWLVIREVDSGVPCPVEIKTLRAEARAKIVR